MRKSVLIMLGLIAMSTGLAQVDQAPRKKNHSIDDWARLLEFSYGSSGGERHIASAGYGLTIREDWALGVRVDYLAEQERFNAFSLQVFTRHYFLDGPLRIMAEASPLHGQFRSNRMVGCGSTYFDFNYTMLYQLGGGITYPVSRMGDPLNLELMAYYRSPYAARHSSERFILPMLKIAVYM